MAGSGARSVADGGLVAVEGCVAMAGIVWLDQWQEVLY